MKGGSTELGACRPGGVKRQSGKKAKLRGEGRKRARSGGEGKRAAQQMGQVALKKAAHARWA